jgi:hypothetical protein
MMMSAELQTAAQTPVLEFLPTAIISTTTQLFWALAMKPVLEKPANHAPAPLLKKHAPLQKNAIYPSMTAED